MRVKTLKRLLPMKVVQLNDVQPVLCHLQKGLTAMSTILLVFVDVVFIARCHGVNAFLEELVSKVPYISFIKNLTRIVFVYEGVPRNVRACYNFIEFQLELRE